VVPRNEFARPVVIDPWPEAGIAVELIAEPAERRALARRFGLLELDLLRARGRLERGADSRELCFRGVLEAEVVQACVVSLEPVATSIREPIERRYRRDPVAGGDARAAHDRVVWVAEDDDEESEVEIVSGRTIDLGEAVAEELALALDPYPHAGDAADLVGADLGPDITFGAAEPGESPFAALRQLQKKRAR